MLLADKKRTSLCLSKCLCKYWIEISICLGSDITQQRDCELSIENVTTILASVVSSIATFLLPFESCENRNESCRRFLHLVSFASSVNRGLQI